MKILDQTVLSVFLRPGAKKMITARAVVPMPPIEMRSGCSPGMKSQLKKAPPTGIMNFQILSVVTGTALSFKR